MHKAMQFVAVLLLTALTGCQSVSLVYRLQQVTANELDNVDAALRSGALAIDDIRIGGQSGCEAKGSSGVRLQLQRDSAGNLRNASLSASVLDVSSTGPNSRCTVPQTVPSLRIDSGTGIVIGTPDTAGTASIFIDGVQYTNTPSGAAGLYYKFVIQSRDPNSGVTSGTFEFLGRNRDDLTDLRVIFVRVGTFSASAP